MYIQNLLITVCLIGFNASYSKINAPFIKAPIGQINGYYKISAKGNRYAAYEGIPYVQPPIGELRFQPPIFIKNYSKIINATKLPDACVQYNSLDNRILGNEDCLYLNIYVPLKNTTEPFPVIFWIHGGGFQYGTSSNYGAKFLIDKDLILVTFNYRLGPFGFLSTGDEIVPGNMGLKDQSMALQWVSENIPYFNGNPKKITLTGSSAGGASVHYHYLSPMSAGRFRNGISFSGTALARWAHTADTTHVTILLAKALNCSTNSSTEIVRCLRKIPAMDIAKEVRRLLSGLYFSYVLFPPVTEKIEENYFIDDSPTNIIKQGNVSDVPWITGIVSEEGLYITAGFALNETMMEYTDKNWISIAPYMLHYVHKIPKSKHGMIAKLAKEHYIGHKLFTTNRTIVRNLTHLAGDDQIVTSAMEAAKLQANVNESPVWFYYYTYRAEQSFSDHLANTTENLGVSHGDDIYLVLENKYIDPTTTPEDRAMLDDMLNFWDSVARNSEPNLGTTWTKVNHSAKNFQYMHIAGPDNFTIQTNNNLGEISFWKKIGL